MTGPRKAPPSYHTALAVPIGSLDAQRLKGHQLPGLCPCAPMVVVWAEPFRPLQAAVGPQVSSLPPAKPVCPQRERDQAESSHARLLYLALTFCKFSTREALELWVSLTVNAPPTPHPIKGVLEGSVNSRRLLAGPAWMWTQRVGAGLWLAQLGSAC